MTGGDSGEDGPGIVTGGAPAAAAEVGVVLVHGRGGTAEGLLRLADEFYRPGVTFLAPEADRGSWFPNGHDAPIPANEPDLTTAVGRVREAVEAARDIGLGAADVVLVGISQGGCVVGETLLRHPDRFGGAFVVSAALPGRDISGRRVDGDLDGTPVVLDCSEEDPYVPVERVEATARVLEEGGAAVETRIDRGSGHGLSDAGIERVGTHVETLLAR